MFLNHMLKGIMIYQVNLIIMKRFLNIWN